MMRLHGLIKQAMVSILVDTGSTHNFISESSARQIGCQIKQSVRFPVKVADGAELKCVGCCEKVCIVIGPLRFITDLYVLPIYGSEVILGVHWLQKLGQITWDFSTLTMAFAYQGLPYILHGLQDTKVTTLDRSPMHRLLSKTPHAM